MIAVPDIAPRQHPGGRCHMDLSPTTLILVCVVILTMLAWAYFDFRNTDTI